MYISPKTGSNSGYQVVIERKKKQKGKCIKRWRNRGGVYLVAGGREYERTGELRQSPNEACAFWPVEAVNRQGSLVFCA